MEGRGKHQKFLFIWELLLVNILYFCKSADHQLSKIFIFLSLPLILFIFFAMLCPLLRTISYHILHIHTNVYSSNKEYVYEVATETGSPMDDIC